MNLSFTVTALALAALGSFGAASAATAHDEAATGDLSNNGLAPTPVTFAAGSNQVLGSTGRGAAGIDRDYFSFTLAAGQQLSAIFVVPGTATLGAFSFIGIESGHQLTLPTTATTAAGLLGWWHYAAADVATNILDDMGMAANGSSGFTPPLGAGTYAVWVQDTGAGATPYGFDFQVTAAVPEPQAWALLLAGLGVLGFIRRRHQG